MMKDYHPPQEGQKQLRVAKTASGCGIVTFPAPPSQSCVLNNPTFKCDNKIYVLAKFSFQANFIMLHAGYTAQTEVCFIYAGGMFW